jgi:hypothetical protein
MSHHGREDDSWRSGLSTRRTRAKIVPNLGRQQRHPSTRRGTESGRRAAIDAHATAPRPTRLAWKRRMACDHPRARIPWLHGIALVPGSGNGPGLRMTRLNQLATNLWETQHHRRELTIHISNRMSVVRLAGGGLWLYSPVPIDDALAAELDALGPVAHIVAPNKFHHLFAGAAKRRYAGAMLWGAPGLAQKRPRIPFDRVVEEAQPWGAEIDVVVMTCTPRFAECVCFHRPSGTLLCCDFFFNVQHEGSFLGRLIFRSIGVYQRPAQSAVFRLSTNRQKARPLFDAVLAWDVQRVSMSHGEVLEKDAAAALARALDRA